MPVAGESIKMHIAGRLNRIYACRELESIKYMQMEAGSHKEAKPQHRTSFGHKSHRLRFLKDVCILEGHIQTRVLI